jgi:hypothetical protein
MVLKTLRSPAADKPHAAASMHCIAEEGKPVPDKTITFNIKNPDGTVETQTATTGPTGKATIQLVKVVAFEVKVTASTTSSKNKPVESGAEAHVIW